MKKAPNPRLVLSFAMAVFGTLGLFTRFIPVSSGELALYRAVLAMENSSLLMGSVPIRFSFLGAVCSLI